MPSLIMFRLVVACLLFLFSSPASAAELKGKVTGVTDRQVRISVEGDYLPQAGDEVTISFQLPGGPLLRVGTWKVSEVRTDFVEATLVEATGTPTVDQIATINSSNPTRRSAPAAPSAKPARTRLRYQGKIYDTYHQRIVVKGQPIDYYFFETPPAGNVPAVVNGKPLQNQFMRVPAADHPDQSKVNWTLSQFIYENGRWELDFTDHVTVEVLDRDDGPPKKR